MRTYQAQNPLRSSCSPRRKKAAGSGRPLTLSLPTATSYPAAVCRTRPLAERARQLLRRGARFHPDGERGRRPALPDPSRIIDKDVVIAPGTEIGYNLDEDRKRFHVTPSGIVVIGKGVSVEEQEDPSPIEDPS